MLSPANAGGMGVGLIPINAWAARQPALDKHRGGHTLVLFDAYC
jgi:hypothetical protein